MTQQRPAGRRHHRFSVRDYYQMDPTGIIGPEDRVELIEGVILDLLRPTPLTSSIVMMVPYKFRQGMLRNEYFLSTRNPLRLDDYNEPIPDLKVIKYRDDFYRESPPTPADTFLVIEVPSEDSEFIRQVKLPLYAQFAVVESWLVDVYRDVIEVYRDPAPAGYQSMRIATRGESISPAAFPDIQLTVDEILG